MAQPGNKHVHKSKRHNNPMAYKSGKPRLRTLNIRQLSELLTKTQTKKEQAKIYREMYRQNHRIVVKLQNQSEALSKYTTEELFQLHLKHKKWKLVLEEITK